MPRDPRSGVMGVTVVIMSLVALLVLPAQQSQAEGKKISGTGKFGPTMSQALLLPTDVPKREITLVNRVQTWNSADPDWNNVEVTQFVFADYVAGTGYPRGYWVNVHPGGDKTFLSYEGRTTRTANPDGSWESKFEGAMRFTGGTGKFQGITGEGRYVGKGASPGPMTAVTATFEWQAEYSLPK
jgi:hypothetical protein